MSYLDEFLLRESIWLIHTAHLSSRRGIPQDWFRYHPLDPHTHITLESVRKHLLEQKVASKTTIDRFIRDKLVKFPGLRFVPYKTASNRLIDITNTTYITEYLIQSRIELDRYQQEVYRANPGLKEDIERNKKIAHKQVLEWFEENGLKYEEIQRP